MSDGDANHVLEQYSFFKQSQDLETRSHIKLTQKNAAEAIETLVGELNGMGIKVQDVYLKFDSQFIVSALLTVSRDLLFSEDFDVAYEVSIDMQKKAKKDFFEICYHFASNYSDNFEQNIASDGYFLKRQVVK